MPVVGSNVTVPQGKEFELLPVDVYQVELVDVSIKTQTKYQSTEEEDVFVFDFAVIEEGEHYGRHMWQYCAQKLSKYNGGSNLYKVLVGLNGGKDLSQEAFESPEVTLADDAINALIGKQVRISVGQKAKQDKTMKNIIEAYLPVKTELPAFDKSKVVVAEVAPEKDLADEVSFDA